MTESNSSNSSKTESRSTTQAIAPLLAGLSGGAVSTIALYPLDLIKVRLQVNEDASTSSLTKGPKRLSSLQACRVIIRHEGVMGLYQGLTPAVLGSALSWGGYFFAYEGLKREYSKTLTRRSTLNSLENFCFACLAGAGMVVLTNPVWLLKTRLQLQMTHAAKQHNMKSTPYTGMLDAGRTIVREEGFLALYKGAAPALLLVSHGGVQFVVYEFLKRHFHYSRAQTESNKKRQPITERLHLSMGYLAIGAIAKIVASTTTYPLQVIKARLQQRSETLEVTSTGELRVVKREYGGLVDATRKIFQKEGVTGFFKGCIPNAIRVAPGAALTFVVYETVMDFFDNNQ